MFYEKLTLKTVKKIKNFQTGKFLRNVRKYISYCYRITLNIKLVRRKIIIIAFTLNN